MLMTVHVCVAQAVCQATAQPTPLLGPHAGVGVPRSHHTNGNVDSLSLYAKAYACQSGQQLKVLGEAGFKYLSGAVENWRAAATDHGSKDKFPAGGLVLYIPNILWQCNLQQLSCHSKIQVDFDAEHEACQMITLSLLVMCIGPGKESPHR